MSGPQEQNTVMPDSPMKSKPEAPSALACAWTASPVPLEVPHFKQYKFIEQVFLFEADGKKNDNDGLANGPHAIFAGVKRDMDGLLQFVSKNQGTEFKTPHQENLFRWQVDEIKKRLDVIYLAFTGRAYLDLA